MRAVTQRELRNLKVAKKDQGVAVGSQIVTALKRLSADLKTVVSANKSDSRLVDIMYAQQKVLESLMIEVSRMKKEMKVDVNVEQPSKSWTFKIKNNRGVVTKRIIATPNK